MKVYFFSGLGADKRIFQKLKFPEIYEIIHVDWIAPHVNENFSDYCKRLSAVIDKNHPYSLLGVSFGGIVATELSKILKPEKIIIISSVSISEQLPGSFLLFNFLKIHKWLPDAVLKSANRVFFWVFGAETNEDRMLLRSILHDSDVKFLRWAIEAIFKWKNSYKPKVLHHIHGIDDRIFPLKKVNCDSKINGGHLMVYNRHEIINPLIIDILNK